MEKKQHWAWPAFTSGLVPKSSLHIHLEQEFGTYVRDFPQMVGWAYVQCPIPEVRRALAANLYEEETGGIAAGRPHPELFLDYPRGLGMDLSRFFEVVLLPASEAFRRVLNELTQRSGWAVAAAVTTLFIEGTPYERGELDASAPRRPEPPLSEHPLVRFYGLPLESLSLTKAHRKVEGSHRADAWRIVLDHTPPGERERVIEAMERALEAWLSYRDGVAGACGIERGDRDEPRLAGRSA
jgi:pyrroloquinoline-quinone synthase